MDTPTIKCALLAAMVAKHRWGTPITADHLLAIAAIEPGDEPRARAVYAELRAKPYITYRGDRGIELDSGRFGELAEVLYHECNWEPFQLRSRLKHYEGWDRHDWA